jgi:hypothetical protein
MLFFLLFSKVIGNHNNRIVIKRINLRFNNAILRIIIKTQKKTLHL